MVPSPEALVKLSFIKHAMAGRGRRRAHNQRDGEESSTTLGVPHTDDEQDNVATSMEELHKPPGPLIGAAHGTETRNRELCDLDDLQTSELKPLKKPINEMWKEEMVYLLLLVSPTVSYRALHTTDRDESRCLFRRVSSPRYSQVLLSPTWFAKAKLPASRTSCGSYRLASHWLRLLCEDL